MWSPIAASGFVLGRNAFGEGEEGIKGLWKWAWRKGKERTRRPACADTQTGPPLPACAARQTGPHLRRPARLFLGDSLLGEHRLRFTEPH